MEIRQVPSCYDKNHLPALTSTQLLLFHEVYVKQVSGPTTTSWGNECNVLFPINEEGKLDVKRGVYETNNQPKKETFKYKQEGRFCLGLSKVENKYGTITWKRCPVFNYKGKNIVTIDAYKNKS